MLILGAVGLQIRPSDRAADVAEKRPRAWDVFLRPAHEKKRPAHEKMRPANEKKRPAREKKRAAFFAKQLILLFRPSSPFIQVFSLHPSPSTLHQNPLSLPRCNQKVTHARDTRARKHAHFPGKSVKITPTLLFLEKKPKKMIRLIKFLIIFATEKGRIVCGPI